MRIFDISLPIHERMPVYPGNPLVRIRPLRTATSYLSELTFGSHTGTHIDAPRHAKKSWQGIDSLPLERMVGPCRVIDFTHAKISLSAQDFLAARARKGERILVKTKNSERGFKVFRDDYIYLESDAATFLAKRGIALFGIDSLSVKKRGSADNRAHTEFLGRGIPIAEGLDLSRVKTGRYFLAVLPLNIRGGDGAPARAILIK